MNSREQWKIIKGSTGCGTRYPTVYRVIHQVMGNNNNNNNNLMNNSVLQSVLPKNFLIRGAFLLGELGSLLASLQPVSSWSNVAPQATREGLAREGASPLYRPLEVQRVTPLATNDLFYRFSLNRVRLKIKSQDRLHFVNG